MDETKGQVKHRKKPASQDEEPPPESEQQDDTQPEVVNRSSADPLYDESSGTIPENEAGIIRDFVSKINLVIGISAMVVIGYRYSLYIHTLHENDMWFSEIRVMLGNR